MTFKSITSAIVVVSQVAALKCGPGFFPTIEGCKCIDQWAVPTGNLDVCACLDQTDHWNADGTFCGITNAVDLAAINSARTRFYPFDNAASRAAKSSADLAAWVAKQKSRAVETRDAGFDALPNPKEWHGSFGENWWVAPEDWFVGPWQYYGGVWEPYAPGNWYWNGSGWMPNVYLPSHYWGDEKYYYYGGWWYNFPKYLQNEKAKLDAAHLSAVQAIDLQHKNRVDALDATAQAAQNMINAAQPIDAAIEATPWTNDIDNLVMGGFAGIGMSQMEAQWLGKSNPFNNQEPLNNGFMPSFPNNNRMPSTPPSLMNVPNILPQFP